MVYYHGWITTFNSTRLCYGWLHAWFSPIIHVKVYDFLSKQCIVWWFLRNTKNNNNKVKGGWPERNSTYLRYNVSSTHTSYREYAVLILPPYMIQIQSLICICLVIFSEVATTCPRPSFRALQMVQEQEAGKGNLGPITLKRGVEDL